jgi:gliding motility-associated-like protein
MKKQRVQSKVLLTFLGILLFGSSLFSQTQLPECSSSVPFFILDLSSDPDSIYTTPEIVRTGQCCSGAGNDNYVSFYVTLHPDVAMVEIGIEPGYADPSGSGFYNIISGGTILSPGTCGPDIPGGQPACITGSGPHKITYHKPGSNKVKYYLKQIPKPIFPADNSTRVGCSLPLSIYGLNDISITAINSSNGTSNLSQYNTYMSCTNCATPVFTPGINSTYPYWIDYKICGSPMASICGTYTPCDTVRLYTYQALGVNTAPGSFCFGGSGTTLSAVGTGGDGNYTYKWKNSSGVVVSTTSTYFATAAGSYTVEVSDGLSTATCPMESATVQVTIANQPVVNAGPNQTVCATAPQAFLSGSVQYATGGTWSGGLGVFNPSANSLFASYTPTAAEINNGSVTLTLTNTSTGSGCSLSTDNVTIFYSDTVFATPTALPIACNGGTTTIQAGATGGSGTYTYQWSTGSTLSNIVASSGTYNVTVTDQFGCSDNSPITVSQPTAINLTMSSVNLLNDGDCNGSASVAISGETAPYTVLWGNGQTTLTTTNTLCYGIQTVTVTDANGCVAYGSVVVNKPSCSAFNVTATSTNVDCYGDTDGTAQSFPVGGNVPYSYSWNSSPVQTTQNAAGLGAGSYTVTVTDNVGCIDVASVTILQPTVITNTITHTDVTTIGGSNGTATANPLGGTPGYSYTWTPSGQTTQTATNLTSAVGGLMYYVNVTDSKSCSRTDSVLINQPPCTNFLIAANPTPVSCFGNSDGSAYLVIANGSGPYNIVWSNGATNVMSVSGLSAGNYTVTVTNSANCSTFTSFTITQPDQLTLGLVPTNVTCFGAGDGTVDLTVSGGTAPMSYVWVQGGKVIANHEDLSYLSPGTYTVTVTDANGCTASASIGITQPLGLKSIYTYTDALCNGAANGTINSTPAGGTLPYTYSWTGPSSFTSNTQDLSGLSTGLYELMLSDGNGCDFGPMQVYINQPDTVIIHGVTVSCPAPGASSTIVTVDSLSGGTGGPYQVSFNNGATYQAIGNYSATLPVGATYNVMIKDANNCASPNAFTFTINPTVTVSNVTFNPCVPVGATTIPITVIPTGGNGGIYEVSTDGGDTWSPAGTYVISVPVGTAYDVIIRDTTDCTSAPFAITVPNALTTSSVDDHVNCYNGTDGAIDLTVMGGTTPYSFTWTNGALMEDVTGLSFGTYSVTVLDANSCTSVYSTTITQPDTLTIVGTVTNAICTSPTGSIDCTVAGGTTPYSYAWSNGTSELDLDDAVAGTYTLTVTDDQNCTVQFTATIDSISDIAATTLVKDTKCFGQANGEAQVIVESGSAPYTYEWSNGSSTSTVADLAAGSYSVLVTDIHGCSTTLSIDVNQPDSMYIELTTSSYVSGSNISTFGNDDGWITSDVFGGNPSYSYIWSNGETTADVTNLSAGNYSLIVTDQNGCVAYASSRLTQPGVLEMPSGFSPNGDLSNDYFVVHGLEAYPENKIIIFNRWGNVVYEIDNYANEWNGDNMKGEPLPDGTYFVILTVYAEEDITLNGYVDLRR